MDSSTDDMKQASHKHNLKSKEATVNELSMGRESREKDSISDSPLANLLRAASQEKVVISSIQESTKDETCNSVPTASPSLSSEETPPPFISPSKTSVYVPSSTATSTGTPLVVAPSDQESEQAKEVPSNSVSTCDSLRVELSDNSSSFNDDKSQILASESKCSPSTNYDSNPSESVISKTKSSEIASADLPSNVASFGLSRPFNNEVSLPVTKLTNPVSPTKSRGLKELLTTGVEDKYPTDKLAMFLEANEVANTIDEQVHLKVYL